MLNYPLKWRWRRRTTFQSSFIQTSAGYIHPPSLLAVHPFRPLFCWLLEIHSSYRMVKCIEILVNWPIELKSLDWFVIDQGPVQATAGPRMFWFHFEDMTVHSLSLDQTPLIKGTSSHFPCLAFKLRSSNWFKPSSMPRARASIDCLDRFLSECVQSNGSSAFFRITLLELRLSIFKRQVVLIYLPASSKYL